MTTLITHPVVPLALGIACGSRLVPPRLLCAGVLASLLPDADVLAFKFGIAYGDSFGHRGFSHSLLFALLVAGVAAVARRFLRTGAVAAFVFVLLAALSHPFLDAVTNGGLGVAFLAPFDTTRYFLPLRPITVSPFSLQKLFSMQGMAVARTELLWVWLPASLFASGGIVLRRIVAAKKNSSGPFPLMGVENRS